MHVGRVNDYSTSAQGMTDFKVQVGSAGPAGGIVQIREPDTKRAIRPTVIQSMPKGEKPDPIFQKYTKSGLSECLVTATEKSVPKILTDGTGSGLQRRHATAREAADHCGVGPSAGAGQYDPVLGRTCAGKKNRGESVVPRQKGNEIGPFSGPTGCRARAT